MVELHLTHASITDTDLVDGSGKLAYRVSTPFHGGTTTISRSVGDAMIAVAQLEWHPWDPDIVRYCEQERQADAYLLRQNHISSARIFTSKSGRAYIWLPFGKSWRQLELHGGPEVARSHNRSFGLVGKRAHDAYLEVHDGVLLDLDEIVITFVYMKSRVEEEVREAARARGRKGASAPMAMMSPRGGSAMDVTNGANLVASSSARFRAGEACSSSSSSSAGERP